MALGSSILSVNSHLWPDVAGTSFLSKNFQFIRDERKRVRHGFPRGDGVVSCCLCQAAAWLSRRMNRSVVPSSGAQASGRRIYSDHKQSSPSQPRTELTPGGQCCGHCKSQRHHADRRHRVLRADAASSPICHGADRRFPRSQPGPCIAMVTWA